MKIRVFNDEDFEGGGFRAIKKENLELLKHSKRGNENKRKDESKSRKTSRQSRDKHYQENW